MTGPTFGRTPFPRGGARKAALLSDLKRQAAGLERLDVLTKATVYRANSTLLAPVDGDDYVFVNHARWDMSLPRFTAAQFGKRSFYSYVLANLRANATASMPILYRLA